MSKNRKKRSTTLVDIYDSHWEDKESLTHTEFRQIATTFNHLLMRYLIETGNEIRLPKRLGRLRIVKRYGGEGFDYPHYMKTGILKVAKNKHSAGYYAKFDWDYSWPKAMFKYTGMWRFEATRSHKRYLAKMIKNHNYIMKYFDNEK